MAQKYGFKIGCKLILTDGANDLDHAFTVNGIANYSVGLSVFMDIDSMRELFGQEDDHYNMLLSDKALDLDDGRMYSEVVLIGVSARLLNWLLPISALHSLEIRQYSCGRAP